MCRLFGFRSVIQSQVHRSLLAADNALGTQSNDHPDGWGVAYYVDGAPHLTRSPATALGDQLFHRLSGVVASETVVAHVRKATQGTNSVLNCHPFQYGRWVFAHNGDIPGFAKKRELLLAELAPRLRRYILGDTDSECIFYLLLTQLERFGPRGRPHELADVFAAIDATAQIVRRVCDPPCPEGQTLGDKERSLLTMMITDGQLMAAVHGGKELLWSSHKHRCPDRDVCPSLSPECEAPSATGFVNHLLVSSEELSGENVWFKLAEGEVVGIDHRMHMRLGELGKRQLQMAPS